MSGRALILSGPSGVGKDTLIDEWRRINPRVERVVACTTRPPREGEVDGVSYHFLTRDKFTRKAGEGFFLEWKEVHGNLYGTPADAVRRMAREGKIPVLKIDVQGALAVMELDPEIDSVFILPPSLDELERRICSRGLDDPAHIERRLQTARTEIEAAGRYRHRVINDDVARAVAELERLFGS